MKRGRFWNKKGIFRNKKGDIDIVGNQAVFIILNVVVIAIFIFVIGRAVNGTTLVEQTYAKQIALLIDQAKPGTVLEINLDEVIGAADRNKFERKNTVIINNEERKVIVACTNGKGYSFNFFSNNAVLWSINVQSKTLILEVKENAV